MISLSVPKRLCIIQIIDFTTIHGVERGRTSGGIPILSKVRLIKSGLITLGEVRQTRTVEDLPPLTTKIVMKVLVPLELSVL